MAKSWTVNELVYLEKHYPKNDMADLMLNIKRTEHAIQWKASQLGYLIRDGKQTKASFKLISNLTKEQFEWIRKFKNQSTIIRRLINKEMGNKIVVKKSTDAKAKNIDWDVYFNKASDYFHKHNCLPTIKYDKDIAKWLAKEKALCLNDNILPERKKLLEGIGMKWSVREDKWKVRLAELKEFWNKNNRPPHRSEDSVINAWYRDNKTKWVEKTLDEEKQMLLAPFMEQQTETELAINRHLKKLADEFKIKGKIKQVNGGQIVYSVLFLRSKVKKGLLSEAQIITLKNMNLNF